MMLLLLSSKGQGLESSGRTDIYRVGLLLKTTYEEIFLVSHIGILACKKVSQFQLDDFKLFQCRNQESLHEKQQHMCAQDLKRSHCKKEKVKIIKPREPSQIKIEVPPLFSYFSLPFPFFKIKKNISMPSYNIAENK